MGKLSLRMGEILKVPLTPQADISDLQFKYLG